MIDSNIVGALFNDPDAVAIVTRLQRSGAIRLLITHHQGDQLSNAPHHIRRTLQLLNPAIAVTSGKIWNVSGDQSWYRDTAPEERSMEGGNQRSFKHWADIMYQRLVALGCSVAYANTIAAAYRNAKVYA